MTPPLAAQALVAAVTPPADYESVAGDLQEEYSRRIRSHGASRANFWYWSQALRSTPSLLSYSRLPQSSYSALTTAAIVIAVLLAMLLVKGFMDDAIDAYVPGGSFPHWLYFSIDWLDAAVFGAILALVARSQGIRLVFWASLVLVAAFAVPTFLGFSSRLSLAAWLLILGALPAMSAGFAFLQIARRRVGR